jgi:hypothetical protein
MKKALTTSSLLSLLLLSACEEHALPLEPPAETPPSAVQDTPAPLVAAGCNMLTPTQVSANGNDGNVPANTQDDNLGTRWSQYGKGAWLTLDLGASKALAGATIAWHQGSTRQNTFTLSTSENGTTFTQAYMGTSTLTSAAQVYAFSGPRQARYVRITFNGNTLNDWASIAEARACGAGTVASPSPVDSGPALPRLPYLQSVGPTSALVAFRTSVSCTPYVRFGEGTDVSRMATASAAGWRHAVKLDGLSPGRTYSYVVEACGSRTGVRQFRTASGPTTQRVQFSAMGDFGTGGSLQRDVVTLLSPADKRGELLLALGDNAYESGTEQEFQEHLFAPMAPLLRELPLFASPGNHEYATNKAQPYLDNFYLPANNPARSERYYSFDWGHVHFVSLDSSCALGLAETDCAAAQKSWLAQDLAVTRQPWKVVFFHYPVWSSGEHGSQPKIQREYPPLFEQYGVDLVLTGHDHNYERTRPMKGTAVAASGTKGITYVVVGSGGASLRSFPNTQPAWTAYRNNSHGGFLSVVVDGGTLSAKFITVGGTVRDSFTLTKTLPASLPEPVQALELQAAPGPVDDPNRPPEGLHFERPLPPADTMEATADDE